MNMRTETEMMNMILGIAGSDERIRAVYMNGSRANPKIKKDIYQDYDIVYAVTETESFLKDKKWIEIFGEPAIVQEPNSKDLGWGTEHDSSKSYSYLMLFKDGNRIDLSIKVIKAALETYLSDTLTVRLLDKDNILPEIPEANDRSYWIKPPSKEKYRGCCNEFWWCLNNVAKGIVRKQLPYAMRMYSCIVRCELEKMTEWYIGIKNDFSVSTGMWGKYFEKHLPPELYSLYIETYSCGSYNDLWRAVFTACDLFRFLAPKVGEHFNFEYFKSEDENMTVYLKKLKDSGGKV